MLSINYKRSTMFPAMPVQGTKEERKLLKVFNALDDKNKESLQAFAEFLQMRSGQSFETVVTDIEDVVLEPLEIPRPDEESVIAAIKRLTKTYPMVDKENILHPIADLMTSHMVQGRSAPDVIDDFEGLFKKEYEKGKQ